MFIALIGLAYSVPGCLVKNFPQPGFYIFGILDNVESFDYQDLGKNMDC
jgi:hypothetical protein